MNVYKGIPWAVAAILAVTLFFWYGGSQYNKGRLHCEKTALTDSIKSNKEAVKEKVQNEKKFQAMPASDIDSYGVSRGWVRSDGDR